MNWQSRDESLNQIEKTIKNIQENPFSKRHILTAWNVADIEKMALPPCHVLCQFNVTRKGALDCHLYQRAGDVALGVPFNTASYGLLTHLIARQTQLQPGRLIHTFGSVHIYCGKDDRGAFYQNNLEELQEKVRRVINQGEYLEIKKWIESDAPPEPSDQTKGRRTRFDQVPGLLEQLTRDPYALPTLEIKDNLLLNHLNPSSINIQNYKHHPSIQFDVAI